MGFRRKTTVNHRKIKFWHFLSSDFVTSYPLYFLSQMFKVTKQGCGYSSRTERLLSSFEMQQIREGREDGRDTGEERVGKGTAMEFPGSVENDTPKEWGLLPESRQ